MKTEGAIILRFDLSEAALKIALQMLAGDGDGYVPASLSHMNITVSFENLMKACDLLKRLEPAGIVGDVHISRQYNDREWSVSWFDKTVWSPGA